MENELFYSASIAPGILTLDKEESGHIIRALRKQAGDTVLFTDGEGKFFNCVIIQADPKACQLEVGEPYMGDDQRTFSLVMAVAPTKNINRYEWFIEKATEIGVDEIIPLITARSERRHLNVERLTRVAVAALKQSRKSRLPLIHGPKSYHETLSLVQGTKTYIAWLGEGTEAHLADAMVPGTDVCIMIGPEGDFSAEEVAAASRQGVVQVHLGPYRLRTETAAIAACHTAQLLNRKRL